MDKGKSEVEEYLLGKPDSLKERIKGMNIPEAYRLLEMIDPAEFKKFKKAISDKGWIG